MKSVKQRILTTLMAIVMTFVTTIQAFAGEEGDFAPAGATVGASAGCLKCIAK